MSPGVYVLLCHVHPQMAACIVVVPNSYFTTTDTDGRYRIEDVPAGDYVLRAWHSRSRPWSQALTLAGGTVPTDVQLRLKQAKTPAGEAAIWLGNGT